jgi:hypothetical protein
MSDSLVSSNPVWWMDSPVNLSSVISVVPKLALKFYLISKNISDTKQWPCVPKGREWPVEGWWCELELR